MLFEIQYQRYGDCKRRKRGADSGGKPRRFTEAEAIEFLSRNRSRYPRARLKPVRGSSSKAESADTGKRRSSK